MRLQQLLNGEALQTTPRPVCRQLWRYINTVTTLALDYATTKEADPSVVQTEVVYIGGLQWRLTVKM